MEKTIKLKYVGHLPCGDHVASNGDLVHIYLDPEKYPDFSETYITGIIDVITYDGKYTVYHVKYNTDELPVGIGAITQCDTDESRLKCLTCCEALKIDFEALKEDYEALQLRVLSLETLHTP